MGKIATEQEAYNIGNYNIQKFYDKPIERKLVTYNRMKQLGCNIYPPSSYKSNQCIQLDDLTYSNGEVLDDSWMWYFEIDPNMIFDWSRFALDLSGTGSNYNSFKSDVEGMYLCCIGTYLVDSSLVQSLSSAPFQNVHNYSEPFDLSTEQLTGGCSIIKIETSCFDSIIAICGCGGYANKNGILTTNWLQKQSDSSYKSVRHDVNIRYSDGQMDDNFLSDELYFLFRFGTRFVTGYSGYGKEYTSVGIKVSDLKVSKMTHKEFSQYVSEGRIKDLSSTDNLYVSDYERFPISPE